MDPPPARCAASKRRNRKPRRRHAAAAAATGASSDVPAAEQGDTAQGSAAAAASSSSRRREPRPRLGQDRAAIANAKAEASKSPSAPFSETLRGKTDAQGYLHDTSNCVSGVVSIQGDSSLRSGCCLEAVETCSSVSYQNEDPKCPVMKITNLSGNSNEASPDCRSLQELEEHKENENRSSVNSSNLKEEKKKSRKRKGRNRRSRCKKTTSQDRPLSNSAEESGKNILCHEPVTNSVSVDDGKIKEEKSVHLDSTIDNRCELGGSNTNTERNKLQKQGLACSEDKNDDFLSPSSLAEAYVEKLKLSVSLGRSFVGLPKKKLLILDLNGLLADINQDVDNAHMADAKVRGKLVFLRPYCDDFLKFCSWNFDLGIWSSRKKENVASVVDIIMRDFKPRLLFCWDMSKCTFTGFKMLENKHKPLMLKELRKLWNKEDPDLPWEEGYYSPSNTLLVDDSPYKALLNPPHTAIFPRPYSYLNQNDNSLGSGGDLRVYLQNLATADDVESYVRNNPFGQPFITKSDPHWNFYAQIVDKRNALADEGVTPLTYCA